MYQAGHRRRTLIGLLRILLLTMTVGAGAVALLELPILNEPVSFSEFSDVFEAKYAGLPNTGFRIRSLDGSLLTFNGTSASPRSRSTVLTISATAARCAAR